MAFGGFKTIAAASGAFPIINDGGIEAVTQILQVALERGTRNLNGFLHLAKAHEPVFVQELFNPVDTFGLVHPGQSWVLAWFSGKRAQWQAQLLGEPGMSDLTCMNLQASSQPGVGSQRVFQAQIGQGECGRQGGLSQCQCRGA